MSDEMKPCRRCGLDVTPDGIEVTQTDTGTYTARFECPDCGEVAETCMRHSSEDFAVADVIDEWNRRWVDPALFARIAELEKELEQMRTVALGYCELARRLQESLDESNRYWDKALVEARKLTESSEGD